METSVNILAMLQTTIAAGLVILVGVWALYRWLKYTGKLNSDHGHEGQPH